MTEMRRPLYAFIYRMVQDKAGSEDIFQDTWLRAVKNLDRYDRNQSFKGWIFTIARNLSIDHLRKEKRHREKEQQILQSKERARSEGPSQGDKNDIFFNLRFLPAKFREVLHLRFYEGLEYSDISKILQIPAATARTRVNRGLHKLRTIWGNG